MGFNADQDSYLRLRDIVAERTRPLLAWVGSGISIEAGLPTWSGLRGTLIEELRKKSETFDGSDAANMLAAADQAEREDSPWVAFQVLRKGLGKQSYQDIIRDSFHDANRAALPTAYQDLWELGIKGMLTLNLDRFAVRSLADFRGDQTPLELSGHDVGRLRRDLSGNRPVVANLHGVIDDSETWVFTQGELAKLFGKPEYQGFLDLCFSMFTIVFVGISVQDVAVGGHLQRAADLEIDNPTHYWITPLRDHPVDQWAESVGIRAIRYAAPKGDHSELRELFSDLRSYVSEDSNDPPPVHMAADEAPIDGPALPLEDELLRRSPNEIREVLNSHAERILAPETSEAYGDYDKFSQEYDQAIYQAWYTTDQPGKNDLLGYELLQRAARGAFGVVYRARSPDGQPVAVKVLLDEIRQDPESLRAFRRGVRSMRILQERGIDGMASYLAASEIPAFVVMDWIAGPNLSEAKATKVIDDWYAVLDILQQIARTIRTAHMLPERVLHRDIRPANIMLRDFWTDQDHRDVVVLDFDLSWHRGADEKSVMHTTSVGYLAPEQLRPMAASTRSALVDSFGLGMTTMFLCTGVDPIADQHRHETWVADVETACKRLPTPPWTSLPQRVARMIVACTREIQANRWDLAQIDRELQQLSLALHTPTQVTAPELIAEEVASRCYSFRGYAWSEDRGEALRDSPTGLRLALRGNSATDEILVSIEYGALGGEERAKLNRYLAEAAATLGDQLRAQGWRTIASEVGYAALNVQACMSSQTAASNIAGVAEHLEQALSRLNFERV